jgi:PEP-CTERM motif
MFGLMSKCGWSSSAALAALVFCVTPANFNAFTNWTVDNGTVDYIRSGAFGISCVGGAGGCVDLDGSTSNGGRMLSNTTFSFLAGESYRLTLDVSGNQRGGAADIFNFGILGFGFATPDPLASGDPFTQQSFGSFSSSTAFSGQLFIETSSNDNVGVIIDNVSLECVTCLNGNVPEPGALSLLGLGLAGLGVGRRRSATRQ